MHLGGILKSPPEYLNLGKIVYDGCIRNVRENGIMFDLKDISNSHGSQEGCPAFDQHCPLRSSNHPCARNGSCVASREGFSCVCPPGFGGTLCETGKENKVIYSALHVSKNLVFYLDILNFFQSPLNRH